VQWALSRCDLQSHSDSPSIGIPDIRQQSPGVRQRTTRKSPSQEPEDQDRSDVLAESTTDLETDVAEESDKEDCGRQERILAKSSTVAQSDAVNLLGRLPNDSDRGPQRRGPTQYPATNNETVKVATSFPNPKYSVISATIPLGAELANVELRTNKLPAAVMYQR
jgi:hypothetical protein